MEAILRAVRKNTSSRHQKLSENVSESREVIKQGVTFRLKYLGSTLVEELEDDSHSYGDGMGALAVKATVTMSKAAGKKSPEVIVSVSDKGINVRNAESNCVLMTISIYRINFCTADKAYEKVFAIIARNTDNETMECHAFLCTNHKMAETVALTVAQSFSIAKDEEESGIDSVPELGFRGNLALSRNSDTEDNGHTTGNGASWSMDSHRGGGRGRNGGADAASNHPYRNLENGAH